MRLPTADKRTVVIGRTGSGKTVFSVWLLSLQNYQEMPWIIVDYKGDDLIAKVCRRFKVKELKLDDKAPTKPGLYIIRPRPLIDDDAVEAFLWKVYEKGHIGLYIDEGFALPQSTRSPFTTLLTQGRALNIPIIVLYQRPVWMNKFTVAQADFFAIFRQDIEGDLKTTAQYIKPAVTPSGELVTVYDTLPKYWSLWYDVSEGETSVLRPVPTEKAILENFAGRLGVKQFQQRAFI